MHPFTPRHAAPYRSNPADLFCCSVLIFCFLTFFLRSAVVLSDSRYAVLSSGFTAGRRLSCQAEDPQHCRGDTKAAACQIRNFQSHKALPFAFPALCFRIQVLRFGLLKTLRLPPEKGGKHKRIGELFNFAPMNNQTRCLHLRIRSLSGAPPDGALPALSNRLRRLSDALRPHIPS